VPLCPGFHVISSTSDMGHSLVTDCQGMHGPETLFRGGPLLTWYFRGGVGYCASYYCHKDK
jgi:hypothetical protein